MTKEEAKKQKICYLDNWIFGSQTSYGAPECGRIGGEVY